MSLTLKFNKLLIANGAGSALVHLEDGQKITVTTIRSSQRSARRPHLGSTTHGISFTVDIGHLNHELQQAIRADIQRTQQRIHDEAPGFRRPLGGLLPNRDARGRQPKLRAPRQIPVEKPPFSINITDDYKLEVVSKSTYNGYPHLEVGSTLVVCASQPHKGKQYPIGVIAAFTLI
jgi:hypothetical protein